MVRKAVTIKLDEELWHNVKVEATVEDMEYGEFVERALKHELAKKVASKTKKGNIKDLPPGWEKGLAGVVIEDEEGK